MPERCITFGCGGEELVGILHLPESGPAEQAMLIIVGGPQYRVGSHRQFVQMARACCAAGFAVLRFDYRGMGDSTGETRAFDTAGRDIHEALRALQAEVPSARGVTVFGLCDGASAALMFAAREPAVNGLVLANPWVRSDSGRATALVRHYYRERLLDRAFWSSVLEGKVNLRRALRSYLSTALKALGLGASDSELDNGQDYVSGMKAGLGGFRGPVLLLISEGDLTAQEFELQVARDTGWKELTSQPNVTWLRIPGTDHTFSNRGGLRAANDAILAWLCR